MEFSSSFIFDLLKGKTTFLYHANSVLTSCQFLLSNGLMSRGLTRRSGRMTSQYTDSLDKEFGIWNDVFIDTVDIHYQANRRNKYGPVTFILSKKIFKYGDIGGIWVTKTNPSKWTYNTPFHAKWFISESELKHGFNANTFDHILVFRHCGGFIPFTDHLVRIILDDPQIYYVQDNIDYYSLAWGALTASMVHDKIYTINKRKCCGFCNCIEDYQGEMGEAERLFKPHLMSK